MTSKLNDIRVLLGVTGGIAAYKAVDLASKLTSAGAIVDCILTDNAQQLIRPKSFEAIVKGFVFCDMWEKPPSTAGDDITHISVAQRADILVIAPATANIIAKAANAICDDLLSTTICGCWNRPVLVAPAMNNNMWSNPQVQKNIATLKEMGFEMIGPETGRLACGDEAIGRMSEPADILAKIQKLLSKS